MVAMAKETSSSFTFIIGAVAIMAEFPHIAVPTAIKYPRFFESPNLFEILMVKNSAIARDPHHLLHILNLDLAKVIPNISLL